MENFADEVKSVTNKFQIGADLLAEFGSKSDEVLSFLKVLDQYIKSSEQKDELTKQELSTLRKQRLNAGEYGHGRING